MTLRAQIGTHEHRDTFAFHVFAKPPPVKQTVTLYDPVGKTRAMLAQLGCSGRGLEGTLPPAR